MQVLLYLYLTITSILGDAVISILKWKCNTGNIPPLVFDSFPVRRGFICSMLCSRNKKCFAATYSSDKQCFFHEKEVTSCTQHLTKTFRVYNKIAFSLCFCNGKYDIFTKLCHCNPGFYGIFCQHDACLTNPCKNFGICLRVTTGKFFKCLCAEGFTGSTCLSEISRQIVKEITHTDPSNYGHYNDFVYCNKGYFVSGVQLRVEQRGHDNTGVNNLKLQCMRPYDNHTAEIIKSGNENEGDWYGVSNCPMGMFMTGFKVRSVPYGGRFKDDSAVTDFKYTCRNFLYEDHSTEVHPPGGMDIGNWYTSDGTCDKNSAVCGIKTRIEVSGIDKTGLNRVILKCCLYYNQ